MTIKIGLIGVGWISRAHLVGYRKALEDATIVAVCDADASRAATVAEEWGAKTFTDPRELIGSGNVDAVDVMLPHHLHFPVALDALHNGLHVLVEKPATRTLQELDELMQASKESGAIFAVAENTPYIAAYQVVDELLKTGTLGKVESVRTLISGGSAGYKSAPPSWRRRRSEAVGGVIYDCGAHSFYLMEWLFGGAADVLSVATNREYSEIEEFAVVTGRLTNGGEYLMESIATGVLPWSERLEVYGSKASVMVDQLVDPVVKVYSDEYDWLGTARNEVPFQPSDWKDKSVADEVVDFISSIKTGSNHRVDLHHIRATALILEKAYESLDAESARVMIDRGML